MTRVECFDMARVFLDGRSMRKKDEAMRVTDCRRLCDGDTLLVVAREYMDPVAAGSTRCADARQRVAVRTTTPRSTRSSNLST